MRKLFAFTLAEVLITLAIIGVVAALTIPPLISKYEEILTTVQLRKTYSTLSNALKLAESEYGPLETWFKNWNQSYDKIPGEAFKRLEPYLQLAVEPCIDNDGSCYNEYYSFLPNTVLFRLKDGTKIILRGNNLCENYTFITLFFRIYLSDTRLYSGKTAFEVGMLNLKDINAKSIISSDNNINTFDIWGEADCEPNSAWSEYLCFMKFARNNFKFGNGYPSFSKFPSDEGGDEYIQNLVKYKVKGWF